MKRKPKKVWCVQGRDGWCACKRNAKPGERTDNVATRCGMFIVLPWDWKIRVPDCAECNR